MAAITLARAGAVPVLLDRDQMVGDALCGGFLSWRTAGRLRAVGIGPVELGAHPIDMLALINGTAEAIASLPAAGFGLSRRALDGALRRRAVAEGARLVIDRARAVGPDVIEGEAGYLEAFGIEHLIARGIARPGRVGITGTSYGGYSSWCAITRWPR